MLLGPSHSGVRSSQGAGKRCFWHPKTGNPNYDTPRKIPRKPDQMCHQLPQNSSKVQVDKKSRRQVGDRAIGIFASGQTHHEF